MAVKTRAFEVLTLRRVSKLTYNERSFLTEFLEEIPW